MSAPLWRMSREKMFEQVQKAITRAWMQERAKSEWRSPSRGAEYWYSNDTEVVDNNK
jgi:hypothetical protein